MATTKTKPAMVEAREAMVVRVGARPIEWMAIAHDAALPKASRCMPTTKPCSTRLGLSTWSKTERR
jgi:hypothetical protein